MVGFIKKRIPTLPQNMRDIWKREERELTDQWRREVRALLAEMYTGVTDVERRLRIIEGVSNPGDVLWRMTKRSDLQPGGEAFDSGATTPVFSYGGYTINWVESTRGTPFLMRYDVDGPSISGATHGLSFHRVDFACPYRLRLRYDLPHGDTNTSNNAFGFAVMFGPDADHLVGYFHGDGTPTGLLRVNGSALALEYSASSPTYDVRSLDTSAPGLSVICDFAMKQSEFLAADTVPCFRMRTEVVAKSGSSLQSSTSGVLYQDNWSPLGSYASSWLGKKAPIYVWLGIKATTAGGAVTQDFDISGFQIERHPLDRALAA